jgi:hypothetical protein
MKDWDHILGWTYEQWVKAVDYRYLCEHTLPKWTTANAFGEALCGDKDALKYLAEVSQFWRLRRRDQPLEVQIAIAKD